MLDALHQIKWEQDGSLTFRRSCAHGVCGSDAMRINGKNRLACKTLIKDVNPDKPITVEPIKGLPVEKDLIVDMEPFFAGLPRGHAVPHHQRATSRPGSGSRARPTATASTTRPSASCAPRARRRARCSGTTASTSGPAAIVNAHRFIFDSRDDGGDQRLEILNDKEGVWRCRTTFNCTDACPRGIEVTKAIQEVKRAIITRRF